MGKYIGHSGAVTKLKWAPDEKQIISVSNDASVCVWNFYPEWLNYIVKCLLYSKNIILNT